MWTDSTVCNQNVEYNASFRPLKGHCYDESLISSLIYPNNKQTGVQSSEIRLKQETDKPFKCDECDESYNIRINLIIHKYLQHTEHTLSDYCCPICSKVSTRLSSYRSHLLIHSVDDQIVCNYCGDVLSTQFLLDQHMKQHYTSSKTYESNFKCCFCHEILPDIGKYRQHMFVYHKNQMKSNSTKPQSDQKEKITLEKLPVSSDPGHDTGRNRAAKNKFLSNLEKMKISSIKRRVFEKRQNDKETTNKNQKPICFYCRKSFRYHSELKRHMVVHTKNKEFACDICAKTFTQRKSLLFHQQKCIINMNSLNPPAVMKIPKRPKIHCKYCKRATFNSFITYRWHLTSRKSLCSIYERHQIITPELTKFKLTNLPAQNSHDQSEEVSEYAKERRRLYNMNKRNQMRSLLRNEKIETENFQFNRQFSCHICLKRYQKKIHLNEHIKNVHSNLKFSCSQCQVNFANKHSLYRHVEAFHKKAPENSFFYCSVCNAKFRWKHSLFRHYNLVHINEKIYVCPICNRQFNRLSNIQRHLIDVHESINEKPLEISYAHQKNHQFSYYNQLQHNNYNFVLQSQHQNHAHLQSQRIYENDSTFYSNLLNTGNIADTQSGQIVQYFEESSQYYQLEALPQNSDQQQETNQQQYHGNETFDNPVQYTILQSKLSGFTDILSNLFKCGYCLLKEGLLEEDIIFSKLNDLTDHVKNIHSDEVQGKMRRIDDTSQLYHCPHCSQLSESLYAIQVHIELHEKSTSNNQLNTSSSFSCIQCAMDLNSISALHRHIDKKHPPSDIILPYYCGLCNVGFNKTNSLLIHQEQFHNIKPDEEMDSSDGRKLNCDEMPLYELDYDKTQINYQDNFEINMEGIVENSSQLMTTGNLNLIQTSSSCNQSSCLYNPMPYQETYCNGKIPKEISYQYVILDDVPEKTLANKRKISSQEIHEAAENKKGKLDDRRNPKICKICQLVFVDNQEWKQHRRQCRNRIKPLAMKSTIAKENLSGQLTTYDPGHQDAVSNHQLVECVLTSEENLNSDHITMNMECGTEQVELTTITYAENSHHQTITDSNVYQSQQSQPSQQIFMIDESNMIQNNQELQVYTTNPDCVQNEAGQIFYVVSLPGQSNQAIQNSQETYELGYIDSKVSSQLVYQINQNEKLLESNSYNYTGAFMENQSQSIDEGKDPMESFYDLINLDTSTTQQSNEVQIVPPSNENLGNLGQQPSTSNAVPNDENPIHTPEQVLESKKKIHECQHCGVIFKYPSLLARHLLTHTGQRPFSCNYCGAAFNQASAYNNHIATQHEKFKQIRCHHCNKRFNLPQHLKLHILRKH